MISILLEIIIIILKNKLKKTMWIINEKNPNSIYRGIVKDDIGSGVVGDNLFHQ